MITYGSRRYGRMWNFKVEENVVVFWEGEKPDWLVADRAALRKLGSRYGIGVVNGYLTGLLNAGATCLLKDVAVRRKFSDL